MAECPTNFITGTRMDDATVRISMGLRLGLTLCRSHTCQHCGAEVSQFATHGKKSVVCHHHRHSAAKNIIHKASIEDSLRESHVF